MLSALNEYRPHAQCQAALLNFSPPLIPSFFFPLINFLLPFSQSVPGSPVSGGFSLAPCEWRPHVAPAVCGAGL